MNFLSQQRVIGCAQEVVMRKIVLLVICILVVSPLCSQSKSSLAIAVDAGVIDALFMQSLHAEVELKLSITDEFALRLPISLTRDLIYDDINLWQAGLFLDYFPFQKGFYLSISLMQGGFFSGYDKPDIQAVSLNEVACGYVWHPCKALYLDTRLVARDPSGVFEEEYALINLLFPDRTRWSLMVLFGWEFLTFASF